MSYRNIEKEEPKFNHYDLSNPVWKQSVLDFEREFNEFDGGFNDFMLANGAVKMIGKIQTITDLPIYEDLNRKLNALNYLRFLRKRAKENEAKELGTLEINVAEINF